ncbi:MAG: hypothetical protein ACXWKC_09425 [Xanthobacteraceae bacterium]
MRIAPLCFLLTVAISLPATPAVACKCALVPRDKVIAATPVVFDGEVLRVELDAAGLQEVTVFRVHAAIKGVPFQANSQFNRVLRRRVERTVTILSGVEDAACGWDFRTGPQRLTIGAVRDGPNLIATRCTIYNLNSTILKQPE